MRHQGHEDLQCRLKHNLVVLVNHRVSSVQRRGSSIEHPLYTGGIQVFKLFSLRVVNGNQVEHVSRIEGEPLQILNQGIFLDNIEGAARDRELVGEGQGGVFLLYLHLFYSLQVLRSIQHLVLRDVVAVKLVLGLLLHDARYEFLLLLFPFLHRVDADLSKLLDFVLELLGTLFRFELTLFAAVRKQVVDLVDVERQLQTRPLGHLRSALLRH